MLITHYITPYIEPYVGLLKGHLMGNLIVSPSSRRVRDNRLSNWAVVFVVSWVVSLPWAAVHGPVGLEWVVFQALGAAVIPSVAGWVALWRTKGDLMGALRVSVGVAALLLACQVYIQTR